MIPLNVPNLSGNEWKYIKECLDSNWVSSVGPHVEKFEQIVTDYTKSKYAIATSNGTSALHIALLLAGVQQNDLVIVPNITFVAPVNTIKYVGADPVLIDIDPNDWQIDLDLLENFLSGNTYLKGSCLYYNKNNRIIRAIMPVHVLGNMCNMNRLTTIANKFCLRVIEDATESIGSTYNGRHAGTLGNIGCLSFNGNKIITTGGGGMILTNDKQMALLAKHITTQAKSEKYEYVHDAIGYNYRLVNILAALGIAQMEQLPFFLKQKKRMVDQYRQNLDLPDLVTEQKINDTVIPNNWLYTIRVKKRKNELLTYLREQGVESRSLWKPMNQLKMFAENIYISENHHSDKIYNSCISLPSSTALNKQEISYICKKIVGFFQ